MATTQENATFSAHVYGGANAPALPSGWETYKISPTSDSGFYAEAYRNTSTGEVVITYRGTEPSDGGDRRADYGIANQQASNQFNEAWRFARDTVTSNPNAPISTTGHSLGGALAQYASGVLNIPGETFNAPGIKGMSGLLPMPGNGVTNWVVPTDVVGNYGDHVGTTRSIPSLPSPFAALADAMYSPVVGFAFFIYRSHLMKNFQTYFNAATTIPSPIVLDLNGDGVKTTAVTDGAYFDHAADGFAEQTGWVSPDDGLLVRDLNGNGTIDSGRELFGSETLLADGTKAANGFVALAELDSNSDGKIDSTDTAYTTLKIWKDTNGDGYTSTVELLSLTDAGVQSINTGYTPSTLIDANSNEHRQTGTFTTTAGQTQAAEDIWFKVDKTYSIATDWLDVPADIQALPNLQGYGTIYNLHQAMVRDSSGALKGLVQIFLAEGRVSVRNALFEPILFKWTGSDGIAFDAANNEMWQEEA